MKKNVYALLVAINNYPIPRHRLNGCISDRDAFMQYLEDQFKDRNDVDFHVKTLTDSEATKKGIIEGFEFFNAAKDGDICIFYYSGHGSQAPAPKEFWKIDPDRMNESVVCYDSRVPGGKDLMDKELSYLFWKASGENQKDIHFLSVFDCCHSGAITKDVAVISRMAEPSPTPTRLEDYYGHASYKSVVEDGDKQLTPPQAERLIQLSACRDRETAKELRIGAGVRGIFTYSLIEALSQSNNQLTYQEACTILQVRIDNKVRDQTPQLITGKPEFKNNLFFGGAGKLSEPHYLVQYHKGRWLMNAGSVHGIPESGGWLDLEDGSTVQIIQVDATRSEVKGMEGKDVAKSYKASARKLNFKKVKVAIAPGSEQTGATIMHQAIKEVDPVFLELVQDPAQAAYWIFCYEDSYRLTLPCESMPVFRRINGYNEQNARVFIDNAETVAKWRNLLELSNPKSSIGDHEFKIELYKIIDPGNLEDSATSELVDWKQANVFRYELSAGQWQQPAFRLRIINTGGRILYVSGINLVDNFKISNALLPAQELKPNHDVWLTDVYNGFPYKTIPLSLDDAYHSWGLAQAKEYLKVFVSTDPKLDTDGFNQEGLQMDDFSITKAGRTPQTHPVKPDWTTREIQLIKLRPMGQQSLQAGRSIKVMDGVKIKAPTGMLAEISFSPMAEAERSMGSDAEPMSMPNPESVWGYQHEASVMAFSQGMNSAPPLTTLELYDVQGAENITADSPMEIELSQTMAEGEFIMPMGFDAETGLFYPLGSSDPTGKVFVETLPDATPTGTRSLGGSIKIFFHKVVLSKLGFEYHHPQLAVAAFTDGENFEYLTATDQVKARVSPAQRIVLFIHGIIGDTTDMPKALLRMADDNGNTLDKRFDLAMTFDYENLQTPIEQTAKDLKQKLESVGLGEGHGKEVIIIAHSMGGLVSRWFIEKEGGNKIITKLIQVGTPNQGSPWSSVYELASVLLSRAINGAVFLKPYILPLSFLGKYLKELFVTLEQMHPEKSTFLQQLNDGNDPGIPYTVVAGNTQLIPIKLEENQKKLLQKLLQRFKGRGQYDLLDKFLFKLPNDIAVSVDSIGGIPGADKRQLPPLVLSTPCDHISYFADPEGLNTLRQAILQG